jgi:hypothetical protein
MSHYAKVINGIVEDVIVAEQNYINTLSNSSNWIQTSYNTRGNVHYAPNSNTPDNGTPVRYNYAGIGYNYDGIGFSSPQPFPSWILDKSTYLWNAPVQCPGDDYFWDESVTNWVKATSPSLSAANT